MTSKSPRIISRGFTLLETVIAIGVLAVLLSGFMVVFTPAAEGIRKSINVQEADRLVSAVEQQMSVLRKNETTNYKTGFDKAYEWIEKSNDANTSLLVYQYRAELSGTVRDDGTPAPVNSTKNKVPGKDYIVIPMLRRKDDAKLAADLAALDGPVFAVKCTQLVFDGGELKPGTPGKIKDPKGTANPSSADDYPEAVIAFAAEFYLMPSRNPSYFSGGAFSSKFPKLKNPVFTRNIAVRR